MGEPPRVLVVDDDAGIRDLLDLALTNAGYAVALAEDGAAALAMVEAVAPDVILLDMRMPVLDGWAFAEAYRRGDRGDVQWYTDHGDGHAVGVVIASAVLDAGRHGGVGTLLGGRR